MWRDKQRPNAYQRLVPKLYKYIYFNSMFADWLNKIKCKVQRLITWLYNIICLVPEGHQLICFYIETTPFWLWTDDTLTWKSKHTQSLVCFLSVFIVYTMFITLLSSFPWKDQNMGLGKQVVSSLYRKNIQRLTKVSNDFLGFGFARCGFQIDW